MQSKQYFIPAIALLIGLAFGATLTDLIIRGGVAVVSETPSDQIATSTPIDGEDVATSTPVPDLPDKSVDQGDPDTPVSSDDDWGIACTMDVKLCPDGETYVGRTAPSCAFAPCPTSEPTAEIVCTQQQKDADACIEIYAPVCASVQVECVTAPCNPVKQTYPNSCFACKEDRVISYADGGACPGDAVSE